MLKRNRRHHVGPFFYGLNAFRGDDPLTSHFRLPPDAWSVRMGQPGEPVSGILDIDEKTRRANLRQLTNRIQSRRDDPFVPQDLIERFNLRAGVMLEGVGQLQRNQRGRNKQRRLRVKEVHSIEGASIDEYNKWVPFDDRTSLTPDEHLRMEIGAEPHTLRVIDLLTPIGKGQRGLIVAPPRTGKTILMQQIAHAVTENHPEVDLIVLLVDERPEEVTEMRRTVRGEVYASSSDHDVESHVQTARLVVEHAKRRVETGRDVLILMDSITRLARAYNHYVGSSGRTMSGGLDTRALQFPKKIFGAARKCEEGGSLTILGTALVETGSRMDEVIFQEFKGTGNMELVLDRDLANLRIWPAMNISESGTRREELLLDPDTLARVTTLRRHLTQQKPSEAMNNLLNVMARYSSNAELIQAMTLSD